MQPTDTTYLPYTITDSQSYLNFKTINTLFPEDRLVTIPVGLRIIGLNNIITKNGIDLIMDINYHIKTQIKTQSGKTYSDLCLEVSTPDNLGTNCYEPETPLM